MRQYFTYRDMYTPIGYIGPDGHLANNFTALAFTFDLAIFNGNDIDGRKLGYIEADTQLIIDCVLRSFPTDVETVQEAHDKAELWSGRTDITISGENLVIPTISDPA